MRNLFKRRRFSFWYFVLVFVVLILAVGINYLFHTTEAVTCLSAGDGLCQTVSQFTLFEILAYASIVLLDILIVYPILFNKRKV